MTLAMALREKLLPYCERIEVAGSIRRCRSEVNDIDFVILPRPGQRAALDARCREKWRPLLTGPQNCNYQVELSDRTPLQIDMFFARPASADLLTATPGNFGTLLLCRTGSKEHNIWLVERAKAHGLRWKPYEGVLNADGQTLASETEEDIFRALQIPFVKPQDRER